MLRIILVLITITIIIAIHKWKEEEGRIIVFLCHLRLATLLVGPFFHFICHTQCNTKLALVSSLKIAE